MTVTPLTNKTPFRTFGTAARCHNFFVARHGVLVSTIAVLLSACVLDAAEAELNLLAIGDWGANTPAQRAVASAMATYVECNQIELNSVLLLGDNFDVDLPGGVNDPNWKKLFEQMYDPKRLACPFYAVFGNHDCKDNKAKTELDYARQNPKSRFKLPARWYRVDLPQDQPLVTLIALDSNADRFSNFIGDWWKTLAHPIGVRNNDDRLSKSQWSEQSRWLETELSKPQTARWVVGFGHHPFFSDSQHGDNKAVQADWGPAFKNHNVDFYLSGHDHALEQLQLPDYLTSFVVCGGGGSKRYKIKQQDRAKFARSEYGFVHLQLTADKARVSYIGQNGQVLHVFERDRQGEINVVGEPSIGLSD